MVVSNLTFFYGLFTKVFEGHTHYVMSIMFNPKDTNTFASASLDRTIRVCHISLKVKDEIERWRFFFFLLLFPSPLRFWILTRSKHQVWQLGATVPNFTLNGHERGVNCLDYFQVCLKYFNNNNKQQQYPTTTTTITTLTTMLTTNNSEQTNK